MRSFLAPILVASVAIGCGGPQPKGGAAGEPAAEGAPIVVPVPENCDAQAAEARTARGGGKQDSDAGEAPEPGDRVAAVFALAECELLRFGAVKGKGEEGELETQLEEIDGLYAEVIAANVPKYVIGAHVRTGDLYVAAAGRARGVRAKDYKEKAKAAFENALVAADGTAEDTRLDVEISDWVKDGCKGLHGLGSQERRFKVCNPWKGSWR